MKHFWWFAIVVLLLTGTVCANGFETRRLPVALCSPVQSETVIESPAIPPGQSLAESGSNIPMATSPNAIEKHEETLVEPDFSAKEAELSEREKAVEEREKAVEKREAALDDWYTKLSEYREYLNGIVSSVGRASQPVYATYSRGVSGGCANGRCGW